MWTWPHLVAVALKEGGLAFKNAEQAHIGRFGSLVCARSSAAMRKSTFDEQTRRRKEKKKQKKARARAHTHTRTRTHAIKKTNETGRTSRGPHEVKNQGEVEVVEVVEVVVEVVVEAVVERRPRNREKRERKRKQVEPKSCISFHSVGQVIGFDLAFTRSRPWNKYQDSWLQVCL